MSARHNGPQPHSKWTGERIATLTEMWAAGKSASEVAAKLGGVIRNAVLGKAHRMGMLKTRKAASAPKGSQRTDPKSSGRVNVPPSITAAAVAALSAAGVWTPLPGIEPVSIERIARTACRWPIEMDDPMQPAHFCGLLRTGPGPYCLTHAAVARAPAQPKQRSESSLLRQFRKVA